MDDSPTQGGWPSLRSRGPVAAVEDVHAAQAGGIPQIAAFHQFNSHLAAELGVLEIGRVVDAGRQQHDDRFVAAFRSERPQCGEKGGAVVIDGTDAAFLEQNGEDAFHHLAAGEHVGNAAGHAEVIFENHEAAVGITDEVRSDDGDVDIPGHLQSAHLAAEVLAAIDDLARNHTIGEDLSFVTDVPEKVVERGDALNQPALDGGPFGAGDDTRKEVVREDTLGAFLAPIDVEGDALVKKREAGRLLAVAQLVGGQTEKLVVEGLIVGCGTAALWNISSKELSRE